jgi:hypothetical protein
MLLALRNPLHIPFKDREREGEKERGKELGGREQVIYKKVPDHNCQHHNLSFFFFFFSPPFLFLTQHTAFSAANLKTVSYAETYGQSPTFVVELAASKWAPLAPTNNRTFMDNIHTYWNWQSYAGGIFLYKISFF